MSEKGYSKLEVFRLITPALASFCLFFVYQIYIQINDQAAQLGTIQQFITGFQKDITYQDGINKRQDDQIQKIIDRVYQINYRKEVNGRNIQTY